jgi:hypothetical protein
MRPAVKRRLLTLAAAVSLVRPRPLPSGVPALKPGDCQWIWLPRGVECVWRADKGRFRWHVAILLELFLLLGLTVFLAVRSRDLSASGHAYLASSLLICGYLILGCSRAVVRGIRGDPARLRATADAGLQYWHGATERPQIDLTTDAIADVTVEADPWNWCYRSWRLVVVLKRGLRRRRRLAGGTDRGALLRTCAALRQGLGIESAAHDGS